MSDELPEMTNEERDPPSMADRIALLLKSDAGLEGVLVQELGISKKTLSRYAQGLTTPSAPDAVSIAKRGNVSVQWLLTGSELAISVPSTDTDVVWVPRREITASAGGGLAALSPEVEAPREIAFKLTWLRSLGITPANAEFIEAQGDSMWPTIQDGDLMLLDRGYGEVVNGKIYVLVVNGLVVVKRVSLLAFGGLMLISDNDRYPAETVPRDEVNNLNFQARVAWFGRPI